MTRFYVAVCLFACAARSPAADLTLIEFGPKTDTAALASDGVSVKVTGPTLRLEAARSLDAGVTFGAPGGAWDLSAHDALSATIRNAGRRPLAVYGYAFNEGSKSALDRVAGAVLIKPGASETLTIKLTRRPVDPTYEPFKNYFMYVSAINVRDNTLDPAAVTRVRIEIRDAREGDTVHVSAVKAVGNGEGGRVPFFPFVDRFGQYIHADWPGKIYSDENLKARIAEEAEEMKQFPAAPGWDAYGGWAKGPKQKATGFFYVKEVEGKWWFVDPDGRLFWSYGPTGVSFGDDTPVTGRTDWYAELPRRDDPLFGQFYAKGYSAKYMSYVDKEWESYNFANANLVRKFGRDFLSQAAPLQVKRLRSWGFNTIANWSDPAIYEQKKIPYVVAIHYECPKLADHLPDVFDDAFERNIRKRMAEEVGKSAGDPWNIGYFVDNEVWWEHWDRAASIGTRALKAPAASAGKKKFVGDLKVKYGTIDKVNAAWGGRYESFDAILQQREGHPPADKDDSLSKAMNADCGDFALSYVERFFTICRQEVKRVAPNNLYLGCRFHGHIDMPVVMLADRYCDVISYNVYESPGSRLNRYIGRVTKPIIVGEFGIGSDPAMTPFRDEKRLSPGPQENPEALEKYLAEAFKHPLMVGCHFFQYRDQALTGRADGEAVLRGFVNTADTPRFDLVRLNRKWGYQLYEYRASDGKRAKD